MAKRCTIDGCDSATYSRGWCCKHYTRWKKHGDPNTVVQVQHHGLSLRERVLMYLPPESGEGCWEWTGHRDPNGYGRLSVNGTPTLAHRLSWTVFKGPLKPEQFVLHRCDNPRCVKPEHLFLGTQQDNTADKMAKKRHRFGVSRGTAHGQSKLTEAQVRFIRSADGSSQEIADRLDNIVSSRQVRDIRTGRLWRHIK